MASFSALLFSLVVTSLALAENSTAAPALWQKKFDQIVTSSKISTKGLGLVITRSGNEPMAALNADRPMTPASLTKIATAAAVLQKFPIGHQFITDLLAAHEPANDVLPG